MFIHALSFMYWLSHTINMARHQRRRKRKLNKLLLGCGCIQRLHVSLRSSESHRIGKLCHGWQRSFSRRREKMYMRCAESSESWQPVAAGFLFFTAGKGNRWDCCPSLLHLCSPSICAGSGGIILLWRLKWIKSISSTGVGNDFDLKRCFLTLQLTATSLSVWY